MINKDPTHLMKIKKVDIYEEMKGITEVAVRTAFIYCLAELEEQFGEEWGVWKEDSVPLTPEQQKSFDKYMVWRKKIMDFGHRQIRIAQAKIDQKKGVTI